jgi:hypothetical protein
MFVSRWLSMFPSLCSDNFVFPAQELSWAEGVGPETWSTASQGRRELLVATASGSELATGGLLWKHLADWRETRGLQAME